MARTRGDTIDKAIELKSDEDVVARLRRAMPDALEQLDNIACGNVPRNAASILKAIEIQLRYSQPLPKQTVEHQGAVGIRVIDPYALPPVDAVEVEVMEARPEVKALPPVIRRKEKA